MFLEIWILDLQFQTNQFHFIIHFIKWRQIFFHTFNINCSDNFKLLYTSNRKIIIKEWCFFSSLALNVLFFSALLIVFYITYLICVDSITPLKKFVKLLALNEAERKTDHNFDCLIIVKMQIALFLIFMELFLIKFTLWAK